jgi:hypothetical protein
MLGIAALSPLTSSAQEPGSMLVRAYLCPQDYAGPNWGLDCEPLPDVDASVYLDASEYGFTSKTDANGEAFFADLGVGEFVVELGVPGDFAGFYSLCGEIEGTEPSAIEGENTNRLIVAIGDGKQMWCSFYVSPVDSRGEVSGEPVEQLPTTGVGSVVEEDSGVVTVLLLLGGVVLLGGLGMLTTREELFERKEAGAGPANR